MNAEPLQPRRAQPDDALAVAGVWLRSRRASIPAIPAPVHTDEEVREYFAAVVLPKWETWVSGPGTDVVALLALDGGWVDHLYVDPEWTGRGFLDLAKQMRPDALDLWTFQSNAGARRFYERHGFAAIETTEGANEEGASDVHYRWLPK